MTAHIGCKPVAMNGTGGVMGGGGVSMLELKTKGFMVSLVTFNIFNRKNICVLVLYGIG